MRPEEVPYYFRLRRWVSNPFEVLRFRKKQSRKSQPSARPNEGNSCRVQFRRGGELQLRGSYSDYHMFHRIFVRDEYRLDAFAEGSFEAILDVGANVGIFACRAARLARRVFAFEPIPVNFERLRENTRDFPEIEIHHRAVTADGAPLELFEPAHPGMAGSYSAFGGQKTTAGTTIPVESVRLDRFMDEHGIERCDLMKIDAEGAEYEVLYSLPPEYLARIQRIYGEYHDVTREGLDTTMAGLKSHLEAAGYGVEVVPHRKKPNHGMFFASRS